MVNIIRWLKGYVRFKMKGKFPERFINLCARQGISLFNPQAEEDCIYASMLVCDYKSIRNIAAKASVCLKITEKQGLPFVMEKYRKRKGLLAGAVAFLLIAVFMQNFVWTVEINGTDRISTAEFMGILQKAGVYQGAFKANIDVHTVERKIMHDIEDIGWMSINIIGTKAEVEIKEKEHKPYIEDLSKPCNIKAVRDGVIIGMNIKRGEGVEKVGSAVKEGQLLVSGVVEDSLQNIDYVHSDAEVFAETAYNMSFSVQRKGNFSCAMDVVNRKNIDFLWIKVPVTFKAVRGDYTSRLITEKMYLNDVSVPCGISTEQCTLFENVQYSHSEQTARDILTTEDVLYQLFVLQNCVEIEVIRDFVLTDETAEMTVTYHCTEDIAIKENFVVN